MNATPTATASPATRLAVSVPEAGRLLGIGRTLAYAMARTGTLPTVRIGHRIVVPISALEQLLVPDPRPTP